MYFKETQVLGNNDLLLTEISLFPNPADNEISIVTNNNSPIESYKVYDQQGRVVLEEDSVNTISVSITISEFKSAIYFLSIETKNGNSTKQFIKK